MILRSGLKMAENDKTEKVDSSFNSNLISADDYDNLKRTFTKEGLDSLRRYYIRKEARPTLAKFPDDVKERIKSFIMDGTEIEVEEAATCLEWIDRHLSTAKSKTSTIESMLGDSSSSNISRQWGPERTVELNRDPVKGLGIGIISGKLDIMRGGIFIKNVLPDSPAGWNGTLKRGDRILEVSGVDIRNAGHATAVDVIKNATNPVKFIIQSLVPLPKKPEREAPSVSSPPSIPPLEVTTEDLPKSLETTLRCHETPKPESPVLTPVTASQNLDARSASSSNSSSRESTIKRRDSSKSTTTPFEVTQVKPSPSNPVASPSEERIQEEPDRLPTDAEDNLSCIEDAAKKVEAEDKVPFEPLAEGKVLTKKGKLIDSISAGNVKLTPLEKVSDPESEDEFGYTQTPPKQTGGAPTAGHIRRCGWCCCW